MDVLTIVTFAMVSLMALGYSLMWFLVRQQRCQMDILFRLLYEANKASMREYDELSNRISKLEKTTEGEL